MDTFASVVRLRHPKINVMGKISHKEVWDLNDNAEIWRWE